MTAQRITLDDLADFILGELGDTDESIWTKADDIEPLIVDTLHDFAVRTLVIWDRQELDDYAGQAVYEIPRAFNFLQLDRAEWDYWVVNPTPARALMADDGAFESSGNRPLTLLMEGDGMAAVRKIGVPAEDSYNKFIIEFFSLGFDLEVAGEDELAFPIRYLYGTVAAGVKAKAFARDGDGQSEALSQFWNSVYEDGVDMVVRRRETLFKRRISNIGSDGRVSRGQRRDPGTLPPYFPAI